MAGITGVVLAGGQSRRMGGGDKCLLRLGDHSLLDRVVERLRPQVDSIVLSVNGDPGRFAMTGLPTVRDPVPGSAGPLAGVLGGLAWSREQAAASEWLLSVAADTPFFPRDLADRLVARARAEGAQIAIAASGGRVHPVFGLWHCSLEGDLREALVGRGVRRVQDWLQSHHWTQVEFAQRGPLDPFFNINTPEEFEAALARLDQHPSRESGA